MSSSCDALARPPRVLRGAAASLAALPELPPARVEPAAAGADPAAVEAELRAGYEAGFAEGLRAAQQEAAAQHAVLAARAASLLRSLGRAVEALEARTVAELGAVEDAIVAGALALAEAVVGREAAGARGAADAVARALALAPRTVEVTVRLHPDDFALLDAGGVPAGVTFAADQAVARGGCVAEAGDCTVDARLPEALERAREALR